MDLKEIRSKIDKIDEQLLNLFVERMKLVGDVACYKKENGLPILNNQREKEILEKIGSDSPPEFSDYAQALFETLFSLSRDYQNKILVPENEPQNLDCFFDSIKFGLIGKTLTYSYSKIIHEMLGKYEYELLPMQENEALSFIDNRQFEGLNITNPYKELVMPLCDYVTPFAAAIGSVNTLYWDSSSETEFGDRILCGTNTDYLGFLCMTKMAGISFKNKTVLILGNGATSRTIKQAVSDEGARLIYKASRKPISESQSQIDDNSPVSGNFISVAYDFLGSNKSSNLRDSIDIIVNATPVGTYPDVDQALIDLNDFSNCQGVLDVIYNPLCTKLLLQAKEKGLPCSGGLPMLVAQATAASKLFLKNTNCHFNCDCLSISPQEEDLDVTNEKIITALTNDLQNIVLIGMPGSGKTTIAREIHKLTGKTFVDIDAMIEQESGITIPEYFAAYGERSFRQLEADIVKKVAKEKSQIIATGGGVVLNNDNIKALRQNGIIVYIFRPLEELATEGRPLSQGDDCVKKLFKERSPLYLAAKDLFVNCNNNVNENAKTIIKLCFK